MLPELRPSVAWCDDHIEIIDQRRLPSELVVRELSTIDDVCDAIVTLAVRGAPAIGACGAYGVALGVKLGHDIDDVAARLVATRPTAVNLGWAIDRVVAAGPDEALAAAERIVLEDQAACDAIGACGADELAGAQRILTHCNTGRLATAGIGTALGVIYTKAQRGEPIEVVASESRPLLQGARLTAWELADAGISVRVMPDSATAALMSTGDIDAVIVGADRIAANGDTANKIGTFTHALVAKHFGVPFYVASPVSSFDTTIASGAEIEIEMRAASELAQVGGTEGPRTAPEGVSAFNPAFDVTPGELITGIITESGVLRPPFGASIALAEMVRDT